MAMARGPPRWPCTPQNPINPVSLNKHSKVIVGALALLLVIIMTIVFGFRRSDGDSRPRQLAARKPTLCPRLLSSRSK
eukprot:3590760-Heterocapsa_arctica.AAC.1